MVWLKNIPMYTCINCGRRVWKRNRRCRPCFKKARAREGNPNWKGDVVKYTGLHAWIKRNKPKPEFCETCHINKVYDCANISGEYKRDINDFTWLCRSCHSKLHRGLEWSKWMTEMRRIKNARTESNNRPLFEVPPTS